MKKIIKLMGATESKLATPPAGSPESGGGWQADDKKVKFCHLCLKQFGDARPKVYCRKCGLIVCKDCSNNHLKQKDSQVCSTCCEESKSEKKKEDINNDKGNTKISSNDRNINSGGNSPKITTDDRSIKIISTERNISQTGKGIESDERNIGTRGDNNVITSNERNVHVSGGMNDRKINNINNNERNVTVSGGIDRDERKIEKTELKDDRNIAQHNSSPKINNNNNNNVTRPVIPSAGVSGSALQEKINKLEQESRDLTDSIKRYKEMASLVDDCKLKFNQIKKREKSIDECAKEEGMEDMLASLHEDKIKFNQIITQNKKKIAGLDKSGMVQRRLLSSVSDCEEGIKLLEKDLSSFSLKKEVFDKEIHQLQDQLKLQLVHSATTGDGFNAQFHGEWIHRIPSSHFTPFSSYSKLHLADPSPHPFHRYLHPLSSSPSPSLSISHYELIDNPAQLRLFHGAIDTLEKRQESGLFTSDLGGESNAAKRRAILSSLSLSPSRASHNRGEGVLVLGAFHGTTSVKAESIINTGFANLATLDDGWYGKGIYFTSYPEYAAQYCKGVDKPCLLFCYLILSNPFPVIWDDAKSMSELRFQGKSNYKNFGSHYVPVVHYRGSDYRPPDNDVNLNNAKQYDEIVIFQETHILPYAIVHLDKNN